MFFIKGIGFKKEELLNHILNCYNLDGGFGQIPGSESHAAQIFCCISALRSLGCVYIVDLYNIEKFLVFSVGMGDLMEGLKRKSACVIRFGRTVL